ncbi:hypothetical protein DEU56DRAFT_793017 [Suillus clintonianus]|uniref:uncharacterized protein n=1 Tax=Suillus clintonianus TaxID=1904413 RepID=UPI001B87EBB6|nr:uncharacterized protein DEU56DRAFT_793017 [Suillus clintonianus]KAG2143020.1 hypothetical protein DEU56DRAFT_793017 [Suillus clintonianus]
MAVDPLQLLSLIAFLSALEARGVCLTTGLTNTTNCLPFNRLLDSSWCGPSNTNAAAPNMSPFGYASRGFLQHPSAPDRSDPCYPLGFSDTTSSTTSFLLLYQFLLIFSGQFAAISREILSLRRSVSLLESSLSAVEDQIALLTNAHESTLAPPKDEPAFYDTEKLGQQLQHLSSMVAAQQGQMSALHDTVGALQASTVHIAPDHQLLAEQARSYEEFDASQKHHRDQLPTQIQDHIECNKVYTALRQDLQKLSDLTSINDTKINVSLDHLRSQIVDQVKDQNRTEKEVVLLREQMSRKFGAFQSRVSSLTLDAVKVPHGVQLSDQAAKEARRAKAMAGVSCRVIQLLAENSRCVLANGDTILQNDENGAVVPSARSSPIGLSSVASSRPLVGRFQGSDVFKVSSPCVQRVEITAPSDTKVLSNPHSTPPSRQYTNCKENVAGTIHSNSSSVSAACCQDDAGVSVLRRKQKPMTTPFRPKDVNRIPTPSPSSHALDVISTTTVLPRPGLSALQRGHVSASRILEPGDSEYRNKSLYASPLSGARTRGWL